MMETINLSKQKVLDQRQTFRQLHILTLCLQTLSGYFLNRYFYNIIILFYYLTNGPPTDVYIAVARVTASELLSLADMRALLPEYIKV